MLGYQNASYVTFDANNLPVGSTTALSAANADQRRRPDLEGLGPRGRQRHHRAARWTRRRPTRRCGVTVADKAITVSLATDASGAITSTAAQVIAAINATPAASALVTGRASTAPARPPASSCPASCRRCSDLLRAPATVKRGPQTQTLLRIGNDVGKPQGQKVGVYLYCQEHGGEIATSGVCLETAERLVRNYGTDAKTTSYVDNLDIFIVPMINADGATHSIYDSARRTNMANYCTDTTKYPENDTDPGRRNSWGVNINRNFSVGSAYDGFQGASTTGCYGSNYAGPFELSEPETRNEIWVQNTFKNIKFSNNIHSSGGYFMWVPGSYTPDRATLPYPPYGTLNFFDQTASHVLDGIKSHRGTAIRPQRTGPVIDVLYSAAGNSADEAWYVNGIVGYDFEIGDVHYNDTGTGAATCDPGQQPPFGTDTTNHCLLNEGKHEGEEFSSGNYGLLQSALDYQNDTVAPVVERRRGSRRHHADLLGEVQEQRGGLDLLHDRRLDAHHGLDRVEAAARPRAAAAAPAGPGHDPQVDRDRLQGQRVGGQGAGARADRHPRHRRRLRAGDAGADAGRPGDVRRVHARASPRSTRRRPRRP